MKKTETPLCDFVRRYAADGKVRLHMPGHKGRGEGPEKYDITEIDGADSLYEADGIIRESEKNAGALFGAQTFYSAEGSSLAIRAMLYLVRLYAESRGEKTLIAAGRGAHKTFVSAAALLDLEVDWIASAAGAYHTCSLGGREIEDYFDRAAILPTAVYITSPDYTGNLSRVEEIAKVCHERGVLLIVDNAHGAYLKFLPKSLHPMDLGADMCCDSAHKTLPTLTGSAYLHISKKAPKMFAERARTALSLFGSTSPSYLILCSLDAVNRYLADGYREDLADLVLKLDKVKRALRAHGYDLRGDEPMKLTVAPRSYGYRGDEVARYLAEQAIVPEFADPDLLVLMPSTQTEDADLERLKTALLSLPRKEAMQTEPPAFVLPKRVMSVREAVFSDQELLPVEKCVGRVLASVTVACPPAVPIAVSGEMIGEDTLRTFAYYGIDRCAVVKKR